MGQIGRGVMHKKVNASRRRHRKRQAPVREKHPDLWQVVQTLLAITRIILWFLPDDH
jgi:hypothetical protein